MRLRQSYWSPIARELLGRRGLRALRLIGDRLLVGKRVATMRARIASSSDCGTSIVNLRRRDRRNARESANN